ncbi:MAG: hydroxyacid dehydrogenase [Alphaproteobacteria bacterium]|nr:hydroxyacid dehydrogenase [Alphaproteobacteria bacterium]
MTAAQVKNPHRPRLFLTHPPEARAHWYGEAAMAALRALGELVVNPKDRVLEAPELIAAAADCTVIVADRQTPGYGAIFAALPRLIAFSRVAVDIRNVDVAAASAAGVLVTRASPGFQAAVAEWIVGAMVMAARHSHGYVSGFRSGVQPPPIMGRQLRGSTVGIVGYGAIGAHLAPIAHAIGMRVLVCDPYKRVDPPYSRVGLDRLLSDADFVVPLAVANAETENLIDARALAVMKSTAWLINAGRGNLIDEDALEAALDAGRIAGAVLDVGRAPDQMPSLRLAGRKDVLATPHIGGLTPEAIAHQAMETTRQAAAILSGQIPEGAVNADHAARFRHFKDRR